TNHSAPVELDYPAPHGIESKPCSPRRRESWYWSTTGPRSFAAWGRRGHGNDRDWPMSKNSATIPLLYGSIH
ncbi:MAG: hypothetical protein ACE5F5_12415, partial [Acidimicrobiia bacterium]